MHMAIERGYMNMVKMLLDGGAHPDTEDDEGRTPLHWLLKLWHSRIEMVQLLLERGADPHKADKRGKTPLQLASERGYKEVAQQIYPI